MKFRSQYDRDEKELFITNSGTPDQPVYSVDDNDQPVLTGYTNLYSEIQSHKDSVELATLLQRYEQGDETALNKIQGVYADATEFPSTYAELFERVRDAEQSFNGLPPELRKIFNNSPVEFWQSLGTPGFTEKINQFNSSRSKSKAQANNVDNNNNTNTSNTTSGNGGNLSE